MSYFSSITSTELIQDYTINLEECILAMQDDHDHENILLFQEYILEEEYYNDDSDWLYPDEYNNSNDNIEYMNDNNCNVFDIGELGYCDF